MCQYSVFQPLLFLLYLFCNNCIGLANMCEFSHSACWIFTTVTSSKLSVTGNILLTMQSPYVQQGGIIPSYGPVAGGTDILIVAGYLGNSSNISVFLGDTDLEFKVFK